VALINLRQGLARLRQPYGSGTVWVIAALAFATVLIANVLAIGPALVASRSHSAILLKAE
jgi:hypothetical protein